MALRFLCSQPHWRQKLKLKRISYFAGNSCTHISALAQEGKSAVMMTEGPPNFVLYHAARRAGWHTIVMPHCLESLWPDWSNWNTGATLPRYLYEELRYLGTATAVFFHQPRGAMADGQLWSVRLLLALTFLPRTSARYCVGTVK